MYKLSCFLLFLGLSLSLKTYSQVTTQWQSVYNGTASDTDIVTSMTNDQFGNVIVTGFSIGTSTGKDFATIKYNSTGDELWVQRYNNTEVNGEDISSAVTTDVSGNVYVTGHSEGKGTFSDYLTIKYSSTGDLLWSARYNGKGNDEDLALAIAVDGSGNVYITGYTVGLKSSEDYTTIKYNSSGAQQWVADYNNLEANDVDIAIALSIENEGNIYVTGYSIGKNSAEDYLTIKYNPSGDEEWVARYNGEDNGFDIVSGLTIDNSGNAIITGYSLSNNSEEDYLTVKYNSDGDEQWSSRYNGQASSFDISTSVASDNNGNVYVTGYSYSNKSYEDYVTVKYGKNGNQEWIKKYNGQGNDYDIAKSVRVDNAGGVYVTGYSFGINSEENYATVKYNSSGDEQWVELFDGKTSGSDIPSSLILDNSGNVYVSGQSYDGTTGIDYATLKYSQSVGINFPLSSVPGEFNLEQNFPNPFNPETTIRYLLNKSGHVTMKIYNSAGAEVDVLIDENESSGEHTVTWKAGDYPCGVYFYRLDDGNFTQTKSMVLLK